MNRHFLESAIDTDGENLTNLICETPSECGDEGQGCIYLEDWEKNSYDYVDAPEKDILFGRIEVEIEFAEGDLFFVPVDNSEVTEWPWFIDGDKNIACQDCLKIIGPAESPGTLTNLIAEIQKHIQENHKGN